MSSYFKTKTSGIVRIFYKKRWTWVFASDGDILIDLGSDWVEHE